MLADQGGLGGRKDAVLLKKGSTLGSKWKEELTWQKSEARNTILPPQSGLRRTVLNMKILDEEL